jgi:hypothetical protein
VNRRTFRVFLRWPADAFRIAKNEPQDQQTAASRLSTPPLPLADKFSSVTSSSHEPERCLACAIS